MNGNFCDPLGCLQWIVFFFKLEVTLDSFKKKSEQVQPELRVVTVSVLSLAVSLSPGSSLETLSKISFLPQYSLADPGGAAGARPPNGIQFFCFCIHFH